MQLFTGPRPSPWWLAGPVLVFIATAAVTGVLAFRLLALGATDTTLPLDGRPHPVALDDDRDRMIWVAEELATPVCEARDVRRGPVRLEEVTETTRRDGPTGRERGRWRFASGSGHLEVRCLGTGGVSSATEVSVGPAVTLGVMAVEFLPWFALAMLLSFVWLGWLVVLVVRLARPAHAPGPPPPPRG